MPGNFHPADVPYDPSGVDAEPSTQAPNDYFNVHANPDDFGGQVGQAFQHLGAGIKDASEQFGQIQALHDNAAANSAQNSVVQGLNNLYAPPKLDAQGNPVAGSGGYYSLRGSDATNAWQPTVQKINEDVQTARAALTPRQQIMFDAQTRRLVDSELQSVGRHAAGQAEVWQDQQTTALVSTTSNAAALAAVNGKPDDFDHYLDQAASAAAHLSLLKGLGNDYAAKEAAQTIGGTVANTAKQLIDLGRPNDAQALFDKYGDRMDKGSALAVESALKAHTRDLQATAYASWYRNGMQGPPPPVGDHGGAAQPAGGASQAGEAPSTGTPVPASTPVPKEYADKGVSQADWDKMNAPDQGAPASTPKAPAVDPYANIPKTDTLGQDQIDKFRKWNPDPVGNNAANMASLDPSLSGIVQRAQEIAGTKFVVGSGRRDADQQKMAVDFGWSKTEDSAHLTGRAVDLWPVDDQGHVNFDPKKQAQIVSAMKQAAKEKGVDLEAGADFKKSKDMPHFQLTGEAPAGTAGQTAPGQTAPGQVPQAAGKTPHASTLTGSMGDYANAISSIESGGNYQALGPQTKNGDRAYGRYQVMGNNIPAWTQAALGHSLTPQQFLHDPAAQDAVFNHRFGGYVQQFGNPQDAASMWFTGRPQAQGGNAKDVLGTTGNAYVDKFNKALGKGGGEGFTTGAPGMPAGVSPAGQRLLMDQHPLSNNGTVMGMAGGDQSGQSAFGASHQQKADLYQGQASAIDDAQRRFAHDPEMVMAITGKIREGMAVDALNQKAQEQQDLAAQDAGYKKYVSHMIKGDIPADQLMQQIAADKSLSGTTTERLINAANSMGQGKALGTDFYSIFKRIQSNGPDKITSPDQVYGYVDGKKFTIEGAEKIRDFMASKKTPEGEAIADLRKSALDHIERGLVTEAEYGNYKKLDPKGKALFNEQAIPAFDVAYQKGLDSGKTAFDLLTPGSKDYIPDKIVQTFKRSPAQEMKDTIGVIGGNPVPSSMVDTMISTATQEPTPDAATNPVGTINAALNNALSGLPANANGQPQAAPPTQPAAAIAPATKPAAPEPTTYLDLYKAIRSGSINTNDGIRIFNDIKAKDKAKTDLVPKGP